MKGYCDMRKTEFNQDWIFEDRERNRREQVILPHDAMINTERDPEMRTYFLLAGFHGGTYEYTKKFFVPEEAKNQRWILEFEAVYCMSTVSVNGREVCEKPYGFTPFQIELNPHLRYGEENTVRAVANVPKEGHGRWYTGGGIYRPVNLYIGEDAYVELNGVKVTTLSIHPARIRVGLKLHGDGEIQLDILHKGEKAAEAAARIEGEAMSMELEIPDAKLWSAGTPELYEAVVTLRKDGRICDRVTESFGIRTVAVDSAKGLLINGKPEFLRGGCIHNDKGVIGVINNDATELHRAKKIKEAGFNAIRSAHHPMSRSLMKACDEVGLYVMDEAFDYWFRPKGGNPYGGLFEQEFPEDTRAMVEDAYNHPSVILYSIGNEIPEAGGVKGVRIGKQILGIIRSLDTTRLTTMCPSVHWLREYLEGTPYLEEDEDEWMAKDPANQEQDWKHYMRIFMGAAANLPDNEKGQTYPESYVKMDEEATKNLYPCLDVAGYNYYEDRYETLHRLHPERVLLGTETRCTMLVDTMRFAKEHPYVIGDFVWTLQDHLGEANCGNLYYETGEETSPDSERNKKAYPWLVNYGGVIDLNGTILPAIHRYEFAWGAYTGKEKRGLYLASQPPVHNGVAPNCESYRWTDTVDGWTYEGLEGNPTWVDAYTDADSVELYLNGRKAGEAKVKDYFAKIPCIYEPGELLGIAYDKEHREVYRTNVSTAGKETVITAVPDKRVLKAGGQDFAFIDICLTDREGTIKLLPERELFIRTEGAGTLQGFGSAYHRNEEKYNQDHHQTYLGRLQAVIRSSAEKGSVRVFLSGEGVEETAVDLECV